MLNSNSYMFIPFIGYSNSGKTRSIEQMITYFTEQQYHVITLKHTGKNPFTIDTEGKNTWRYAQAGSNIVGSHSKSESSFILRTSLDQPKFFQLMTYLSNWSGWEKKEGKIVVLCEGFRNLGVKHVLCCKSYEEVQTQINENTIAISGIISTESEEMLSKLKVFNLPVINSLISPEKIHELFRDPDLS